MNLEYMTAFADYIGMLLQVELMVSYLFYFCIVAL